MPTALRTADALWLRHRATADWRTRLPGVVAVSGIGISVLADFAPDHTLVCAPSTPCGPDPLGAFLSGLFFALILLGLLDRLLDRLLLRITAALTVVLTLAYALAHPRWAEPWWGGAVIAGWAGLVWWSAWWATRVRDTAAIEQWVAGVPLEVPRPRTDAPRALPTRMRAARYLGVLLVLLGLTCTVTAVRRQHRADVQQAAAAVVDATVTAHLDDATVRMAWADGSVATIDVLDAAAYPVGASVPLAVDGRGLHQPLAEPYDASGWYLLAVLAASPGLGLVLRARRARRAITRLLTEPQPASRVSVRRADDGWLVYAVDARPGDPPLGELRLRRPPLDGTGPATTGPTEVVATLYGMPVADRWCTLDSGDGVLPPARPWRAVRDAGPRSGCRPA